MKRTIPVKPLPSLPPGRKQPGLSVDIELYKEFKAQAAREGRPTYQVLDDAMAMYLKSKAAPTAPDAATP